MGIALDHLGAAECRRIAEGLFEVTQERSGGELNGRCPLPGHEDQSPSFSYNYEKDVYLCKGCDGKGDLAQLWTEVTGGDFKEFCQEFGIKTGKGVKSRPKSGRRGAQKAKPGQGPKPEKIIPEEAWEALKPLPEKWIERLQQTRGWSPEVIEKLDLRFGGPEGVREGRICIPIRDDDGRLLNIRLYLPGAKQKIKSWWSKKGKKKETYGTARLFPPPKDWGEGPLWLCEGESDTLCALSKGLNAVTATGGASTWKAEWTEHFRGRDVIICYDADTQGRDGAIKAGRLIAKAAELVRMIIWPESMLDEEGRLPTKAGKDLTDWFMELGRSTGALQELLAKADLISAPKEELSIEGVVRFFAEGISGGQRLQFKPALLAGEIMSEHDLVTDPETGLVHRYNGAYFERFPIEAIAKMALLKLKIEGTDARANDAANQVVKLARLEEGQTMNPDPDLVCLKNGVFNLVTGEVVPHDKRFRLTYQIPVELDPRTPNPPRCDRWLRFLAEAMETPDQAAELQEFFGYILIREATFERCLFLVGPRASGKSTTLRVAQELVGRQNCAAVGLEDLDKEFHRATLHNRLLNVMDEIGGGFFQSKQIKQIVSGNRINAAYKFQQQFEFDPFCKLVCATNQLPRVGDTSDGFYEKLIIFNFPNSHKPEERDPGLFSELMGELSGIFAWAWVGLARLRERGAFRDSKTTLSTRDDYRLQNNPVLAFVEAECTTEPELGQDRAMISKAQLYEAYKEFANSYGYKQAAENTFAREIREAMRQQGAPLDQRRRKIQGERSVWWVGLRLDKGPRTPTERRAR